MKGSKGFEELLEQRFQRILFMVEETTKRIIKKELRKLKKDIINKIL